MKSICFREQRAMALRLRSNNDVKKSFYYVWYLGAREAKGVDAMPGAIAYLLERERLQEPFKVTLQVSGTTVLRSGFGSARRKHRGNEVTEDERFAQPTGELAPNTALSRSSVFLSPYPTGYPHVWQ